MNGEIYNCEGCERTGAIPPDRGWYECPRCRLILQTPTGRRYPRVARRSWIIDDIQPSVIVRKPPPRIRPRQSARERWTLWNRWHRITFGTSSPLRPGRDLRSKT
jgi:hypothetical protein